MTDPSVYWRVTSPHRITWRPRFKSEEAAWRRVLAVKRPRRLDTARTRADMTRQGWRIEQDPKQ